MATFRGCRKLLLVNGAGEEVYQPGKSRDYEVEAADREEAGRLIEEQWVAEGRRMDVDAGYHDMAKHGNGSLKVQTVVYPG